MKLFTTGLLSLALITMAAGCIIDETVGPAGPRGPAGSAGNANVFTLNFDFLLADAAINGNVASVQFDVPDITAPWNTLRLLRKTSAPMAVPEAVTDSSKEPDETGEEEDGQG